MTIRAKVSDFLKSKPGMRFCDRCLLETLCLPDKGQTNDATRQLAKGGIVTGFSRFSGKCSGCGKTRCVIQYPRWLAK